MPAKRQRVVDQQSNAASHTATTGAASKTATPATNGTHGLGGPSLSSSSAAVKPSSATMMTTTTTTTTPSKLPESETTRASVSNSDDNTQTRYVDLSEEPQTPAASSQSQKTVASPVAAVAASSTGQNGSGIDHQRDQGKGPETQSIVAARTKATATAATSTSEKEQQQVSTDQQQVSADQVPPARPAYKPPVHALFSAPPSSETTNGSSKNNDHAQTASLPASSSSSSSTREGTNGNPNLKAMYAAAILSCAQVNNNPKDKVPASPKPLASSAESSKPSASHDRGNAVDVDDDEDDLIQRTCAPDTVTKRVSSSFAQQDEPNMDQDPILTPLEMEVAWLGAESKYALQCDEIQEDFMWAYGSRALRVRLRAWGDPMNHMSSSNNNSGKMPAVAATAAADSSDPNTNNHDGDKKPAALLALSPSKQQQQRLLRFLVRMDEWLVQRRFAVVLETILESLQAGYRRPRMAYVIAALRVGQYHQTTANNSSSEKSDTTLTRATATGTEGNAATMGSVPLVEGGSSSSTTAASSNRRQQQRRLPPMKLITPSAPATTTVAPKSGRRESSASKGGHR